MALLPTTYRYFDYNPSYSYPNMPASTPTSFNNFVVPRPPANIRWPDISQDPYPFYIGNRRDIFRNPIDRNMPQDTTVPRGISPDVLMNLGTRLMMAGLPGGAPSFGNFMPGEGRPNMSGFPSMPFQNVRSQITTSYGGAPLYPPNQQSPMRSTYLSPYQQIMNDYPFNWLLK